MSGNTVIDSTTTAFSLHQQVYDPQLTSYELIYENLKAQFPGFEELINNALAFSEQVVSLQQEGFISFINEEIASLYQEIFEKSFPSELDIDSDDVDPIIDEL